MTDNGVLGQEDDNIALTRVFDQKTACRPTLLTKSGDPQELEAVCDSST